MTEELANPPLNRTGKSTFVVFLLYLLVSLIITWPLLGRLTTEFAGGRGDQLVHRWTFWWVKEALLSGQNPFYTTMLYYPEGASLLSHNIAWLNFAFWLPLQAIVGEIAAYNLMFLAIYSLNGFALFLFARELIRQEWPAFVAGVIFCTWPYIISHYDHPNMILIFPLPLALLYLGRLLRRRQRRDVILTAVFLAMLGIGRWQLLIMSLPLIAGFVIWVLFTIPEARSKAGLGRLLAAGLLALLLMLPLALPLIQSQLQEEPAGVAIYEPDNGRTDLLAYALSPQMYNQLFEQPYEQIAASVDYVPYVGVLTGLLALIGLFGRWRYSRFWFFMALVMMLLALGPEVAINRHLYLEGKTPYAIFLQDSLIGDFIRRPHRFNIILALPCSMMAGWGTAVLLHRRLLEGHKNRTLAAVSLLTLLIVGQTRATVPYTTTPKTMPAWYETLTEQTESFGVLELPSYDRTFDKNYMAYQTQHGKPIAAGHISRLPAAVRSALAENRPWFLYAIENDNFPDFNVTAVGSALAQLHADNIRYVVLHKQLLAGSLPDLWRDWLTINPIFEDEEVIVYQTKLTAGEDFQIAQFLTDEMGFIRASYAPQAANQGGLIKVDVRWASTAVPDEDYQVCLALQSGAEPAPFNDDTAACQEISAGYASSEWPANEVIRGSYQLPLAKTQAPGTYQLVLGLVDDRFDGEGHTAVLGPVTVHPLPPESETDLRWQNQIQLEGATINQTDELLELAFYWQSPEPLSESYTLFIHIINPETGEIVAQNDAVPRSWTYPTNIWEPGEIVRDEVQIPIGGLPEGDYEIWLGWYHSVSGEPVSSEDGAERKFLDQFQK